MRRPSLPRGLYEPSFPLALLMITYGMGLFLGAGFAASQVAFLNLSLWLRAPAVLVLLFVSSHGVHLLGFVGHEGIHLLLHRNRYVSVVIGTFVSAMTSFNAIGYGIAHWNHHRFTNQASDPDAQIYSQFRTFWSRVLLARLAGNRVHLKNLLSVATGKPLGLGYKLPFSPSVQRGLAWMNIGCLVFWVAVYAALAVARPRVALFAIGLPILVTVGVSGLRGYIEHAGTGLGTFRDTRSYVSRAYTVLFFGNNYHLEHHLYPGVPCYRLAAVHGILEADGFFTYCDSPIETSILGALSHTTSASQYPSPAFGDLSDDPFHPTLELHASAA
jgi:beta-carotene hydroxylase